MILKNQKGFTLIELLVVIVVIGILLALTIPNLFSYQERARDTERKNDLRNVSQQLETYYNDNNSYPVDLATLATEEYLDEVPVDPQDDSDYDYNPLDAAGVDCAAEPCATYTLVAVLENENDPDGETSGDDYVFIQESANR
ncbi:MAG: prepilin-type N-terminal cleavage/methylation domain-containing protein [Candidatus Saccharimonadales bacterium]